FRTSPSVEVVNAFVPGSTNKTNYTVYVNETNILKTVPVISLCGQNNYSGWQACIDNASYYYKCQADEVCLNMTYKEKQGVLVNNNNGYAVARGWDYEFGCYDDIHLGETAFTTTYNPCMIFDDSIDRKYTSETLLAFTEALPALYDYDHSLALQY